MIVMVRIDDRLVHGQVTVGCCPRLSVDRILLIDDQVAADSFEREVYGAAVPDGIEFQCCSTDDAPSLLDSCHKDASRTLLLAAAPATLIALVECGLALGRITVGGMHARVGRRELIPGLFVDEAEETALRQLLGNGHEVEVCTVPGAPSTDLAGVLRG